MSQMAPRATNHQRILYLANATHSLVMFIHGWSQSGACVQSNVGEALNPGM